MGRATFENQVRIKAIDRLSRVIDKVTGKFPELTRKITRTNNAFNIMQNKTKALRQNLQRFGNGVSNVGKKITLGVTAPLVGLGALSVKAFGDLEEGLVGVAKTTGLAGKELENFDKNIDQLSNNIPIAQKQLLEIAQAGGQLGITGAKNLEKFTETIAKLGKASNLEGEEAALTLTRILNVTGEGVGNIDKFASAIVGLGNKFAASESEIARATNELARGIAVFGVGSAEAAGFGTAMAALGIQAEAGGSVVTKAFIKIKGAIEEGGQSAKALSKVTGIAVEDLKTQFDENAAGVFQRFLQGVGKLGEEGVNTIKVFEAFGLSGDRVAKVLPVMAKESQKVGDALSVATEEFEKNAALNREFEQFAKTFNSQMQKLKNFFISIAKVLGRELAPFVLKFAEGLKKVFNFLKENPKLAKFLAILVGVVAILGPLLVAFGTLLAILPSAITGFNLLIGVMGGFKIASLAALAPFLILLAKIALFVTAAVMVFNAWEPIKQFFIDMWNEPLKTATDFFDFVVDGAKKLGRMIGLDLGKTSSEEIDDKLRAQGFRISGPSPQGQELGAKPVTEKVNREFVQRTNNSRVDVTFKNTPPGTKVVSESQDGLLNVNNGMAGAF